MEEVLGLETSPPLLWSWAPSRLSLQPQEPGGDLEMRPVEPPSLSALFGTLLRGVWELHSNTGFKHSAWCLGSPVLVCDVYIQGSLLKHSMFGFSVFNLFSFFFPSSIQLFLH